MNDVMGKMVAEAHYRVTQHWEQILRLHIKPRPAWIPETLWRKIVCLVFEQSQQDSEGGNNHG